MSMYTFHHSEIDSSSLPKSLTYLAQELKSLKLGRKLRYNFKRKQEN